MKEIQLPSGKYLLVKVGYYKEACVIGNSLGVLYNWGGNNYITGEEYPNEEDEIELPPGQWYIVGKASELTNEQWKDIVESDWWYDGPQEDHGLGKVTFYREYQKEIEYSVLLSAIESGLSLIQFHSMKPETTLILKSE